MFFLKCFDIRRLIFAITLFGYGVFAFAISNPQQTQAITIPYRASVLLFNIILFFHDIGKFQDFKNITNHKKNKSSLHRLIIICTFIFVFFYSCRVMYSVYISDNILMFPDKFQYILYWFFMCLIPGINFLFLDKFVSSKYMYVAWIMLLLIGIPSLFLDVGTSSAFSTYGRLATAAINPVALGHYATSLFLISFYILLNKSIYQGLPAIANNTLIYIGASFVGIVVTFLASSRGPIFALLICSTLMLITYQFKNRMSVKASLFLMFLIILLTSVAYFSVGGENQIFDRIFATGDELDTSSSNNRGYVYDMGVKLSLEHPILGFGLELPNGEGYPHNLFLESFLTLGFGGGFMFVTIVAYTIMASLKLLMSKNSQWGWVGVLFIQYIIAGCFSGSLYGSSSFWYFLFAVLGVYNSVEENRMYGFSSPTEF
jgi:O-Antigen ligase